MSNTTMATSSETSTSRCPYCGNEYPMLKIPGLFGREGRAIRSTYCGCEGEVAAEREAERRRLQTELTEAWRRTNVPETFWNVKPDFEPLRYLDEGRWLFYHGPKGTGKSTAAAKVLKAYVRRHQERGYVSARFIDLPEWLASMRRNWGTLEEEGYQRAAGVKLLVLDDIGKGKPTEWAMERLFRLVNDRYVHMKTTIITSQYDAGSLAARCTVNDDIETADAMVSRIMQMSHAIPMRGPDLRLTT